VEGTPYRNFYGKGQRRGIHTFSYNKFFKAKFSSVSLAETSLHGALSSYVLGFDATIYEMDMPVIFFVLCYTVGRIPNSDDV